MRNVLLLGLACLIWFGSWSTACPARAVDELVSKGGRIDPGFYATIQGKLAALPAPAWLADIGVSYVIQTDGQQIYVSFGKDPALLDALSKLGDKRVRLNGALELVDDPAEEKGPEGLPDFLHTRKKVLVVRAAQLEEAKDTDNKDELTVTAVGNLHPQAVQFTIAGPPRLWEIVAGKQSLPFRIWDGDLLKNAVALEGNVVAATGTLDDGIFVVKTLVMSL